MDSAWLGLLDDVAVSLGYARGSPRGSTLMETGVSVKPTLAHTGIDSVVGASSRPDAEVTTVCEDKDSASRDRGR